jgi:hypothetical protein
MQVLLYKLEIRQDAGDDDADTFINYIPHTCIIVDINANLWTKILFCKKRRYS